ncbi:MAG: 5-methylcytosine-specific restriction endonuclease system specificity protein McrC [Barnesiella sp.]|nr:5-methylcytosine-specific restriction endonuclease system specificity protein McrC [Barnesiella sp.]
MTEDKGILIKNIYYMLSYAFQELGRNNYEDIAGERFDEIHDLFAEILYRGISARLKQGLLRRYTVRHDIIPSLKGRLNIHESIALYARGRRQLSCEYDEYSADILFNRILKTTICLLINHKDVKPHRKQALNKLLPFFADIATVDLRRVRWDALRFDRNSGSYRMLMYICYFIADNLLLTTQQGQYRMHSLSDTNMCRLFERFVLEYYRRHHNELNPCARQIEWNIVPEQSSANVLPRMQTDIFLTIGDRTLIIDTKYYTHSMAGYYDKDTIHSHHQYQIYSYVMNHDRHHTGKTDGMLLYARTQEEIVPDHHARFTDGNTIYYRTLNLNNDFAEIKAQLESFITLI